MAADQDDLKLTIGVEEEYFLVDPKTRDLLADPDPQIFEACEAACGPHRMVREYLRSQIETNTRVCSSVGEVRDAICETRRIVSRAAQGFGAKILASSTHPFAEWRDQSYSPFERYESFTAKFQDIVRQLLVGGMHIHAGFGDPDTRIRVMTAIRRYLPVLHALSTSSPFANGRNTGSKSWRLTLMAGLPRTGIPYPYQSQAEYDRMVNQYRRMSFISDGTELWWDIRPAQKYPTIELRICDICPSVDDAVCIVALYASLVRMLMRRCREGSLPDEPLTETISENRWIAQRYGNFAFFGDPDREGGRVDIDDFVAELLEDIAPDALALGCEEETRRATNIVREGTSADRQIDQYRLRRHDGWSHEDALIEVVDELLAASTSGIGEDVE